MTKSNALFEQLAVPVNLTGQWVLSSVDFIGKVILFMREAAIEATRRPFRSFEILTHMEFLGNKSFTIILMSAFAIGAVFALQVGMVFKTFNAEGQMGIATATALARELAPMMTAFLVTGRGGSAITAELATMKVNEQVDALESMGVSPIHYLVVPRIWAAIVMIPLLSGFFLFIGVVGSFIVGKLIFGVDEGMFFAKIVNQLEAKDIWMGLKKSFLFSIVIVVIACIFGLSAKGGAKGVGQATTNSVITTLLVVLLLDFVYTFFQIAI